MKKRYRIFEKLAEKRRKKDGHIKDKENGAEAPGKAGGDGNGKE